MQTMLDIVEESYQGEQSPWESASTAIGHGAYDGYWAASGTLGIVVEVDRMDDNPINEIDSSGLIAVRDVLHSPATLVNNFWSYAVGFNFTGIPANAILIQHTLTHAYAYDPITHNSRTRDAIYVDVGLFAGGNGSARDTIRNNIDIFKTYFDNFAPACHAVMSSIGEDGIYASAEGAEVGAGHKVEGATWQEYTSTMPAGQISGWTMMSNEIGGKTYPATDEWTTAPGMPYTVEMRGVGAPLIEWGYEAVIYYDRVGGVWKPKDGYIAYWSHDDTFDKQLAALKVEKTF